jgi:leucyl aminopeptidase
MEFSRNPSIMQLSTKLLALVANGTVAIKSECLIIPIRASRNDEPKQPIKLSLSNLGVAVDLSYEGALNIALNSGDISAALGQTLLLRAAGKNPLARVLLVNAGPQGSTAKKLTAKQFQEIVTAALKASMALGVAQVSSALSELEVEGKDDAWKAQTQITCLRDLHYKFSELKSSKTAKKPASVISAFELIALTKEQLTQLQRGVLIGQALANGVDSAKYLGNLPGNFCTPTFLGSFAKKLGKSHGFKVEVLDKKQIQALKMGSFLSVTQGSVEPPKLIVMQYQGASAKQAPVALVGKGITFDTGGISLKPGGEMDEMKFDMCGAASVVGAFQAAAELKLKINLVGVIPACENMPSGTATKPGDIFTSMSGQTIEVLNTDAEGRLVLCDALTFVKRFKPSTVIDIATLTGACVVALGNHHTGMFSKEIALAHELLEAGRQSGDTCWHMPMDDAYGDLLKSNFADMANIGGRAGGAITAACFLAKFAEGYEWAHLDIAGTAWKSGAAKGSTGRPVPMLLEFLRARAAA